MPRKKVVTSRAAAIQQFVEQSVAFISTLSPDAQDMVLHQITTGVQPVLHPDPGKAEPKAAKPKQQRKAIGRVPELPAQGNGGEQPTPTQEG